MPADGEDEASRTRAYVASLLGLGGVTAAAAAVVVGESRKAPSSAAADFMPTHGGTDGGSGGGGGGGGGPEALGTRSYVEQLLAQMEGEEAAVSNRAGGEGEGGVEGGPRLLGLPTGSTGGCGDSECGSLRTTMGAAAWSERNGPSGGAGSGGGAGGGGRGGGGSRMKGDEEDRAWSVSSEVMNDAVTDPLDAMGSENSLDMRALMMAAEEARGGGGGGDVGIVTLGGGGAAGGRHRKGGDGQEEDDEDGSLAATDGGDEFRPMKSTSGLVLGRDFDDEGPNTFSDSAEVSLLGPGIGHSVQ